MTSEGPAAVLAKNIGEPVSPVRYLATIVAAVIGTAVSIGAYVAASNLEARLAALKLVEVARNQAQTLNSDIDYATGVLYTLRAHFTAADRTVGRAEFQSFAKSLRTRLAGLRNTGWAAYVTREERDAFERAVRAEGFPKFEIWERDAQGNRVRAKDRAEYFPILYPDPVELTPQILGFDTGSESLRNDALQRARSSGLPAATPPIKLITEEPDGFMSFIPVYGKEQAAAGAPPSLRGIMYGVFATVPMVENILAATAVPAGLDICFFDPNGPRDHRRIYWHSGSATPRAAPTEDALVAGPHWEGRIKVVDQEWGAIFALSDGRAGTARSWQAIAVLMTGLTITAMVVGYLLVSLKHTLRLEFLTASLRETTRELRLESDKVAQLARHDAMTGLANRATFIEQLQRMFAQAKRGGRAFAVMCLDLDHFKDINDTLGHPCGDLLLNIVADRLAALVRNTDVIARLGGDEFAILMAYVPPPSTVAVLAARINDSLAQGYDLNGAEVHVSASIGISLFDNKTGSPEDMMMQADLALYRAKNEGRNKFSFHSCELDREVRERVTIAEELHVALRDHQLELYYQPQVELPSGRITGIEALVRWNHPKRGLLPPDVFVPVAETTGTIFALGRWVLEAACRQIKQWQAEGITPPVVAVNFSAAQFKGTPNLDRDLADTFQKHDVDPSRIEIELTEIAVVETTEAHNDIIERLRKMGISIAIDDFGTGYSSLEYLRTYRVNRLKIAQQFMRQVATESGDAAIVRAALGLARELGMDAVAEGVETAEQLAFLLTAGCRYAQGYYFSGPVPAAECGALLRRGEILRKFALRPVKSPQLVVL
jgi:diguanylate cyclase (GGDEF)-like protein